MASLRIAVPQSALMRSLIRRNTKTKVYALGLSSHFVHLIESCSQKIRGHIPVASGGVGRVGRGHFARIPWLADGKIAAEF